MAVWERLFADEAAMVAALADEIAGRLKARVTAEGAASLVVTGGSTPGVLYEALSRRDAGWDRVSVTLTDERWVTTESEASNERLVRDRLFKDKAKSAYLVPLKTAATTPVSALANVACTLRDMPRPFEVVILGMGADGHFASLFPHNSALAQGLKLDGLDLIAVEATGAAGSPSRLSLTLAAILDARWIAILIQGEQKLDLLRRAAMAEPLDLPIAAVLHQSKTPVSLFWAP